MEHSSTNSCTCQVTCWVSKEHEKLLLLSLNWIRTLRPWHYPAAIHELQPYHQLPGPSSTSRSFCANLQVLDSRRNIRLFGRAFDVRSYTSPTDPEFNKDVLIYFISRTYFLEGPRSKNWWTEGVIKRHHSFAIYITLLTQTGFAIGCVIEWGLNNEQAKNSWQTGRGFWLWWPLGRLDIRRWMARWSPPKSISVGS